MDYLPTYYELDWDGVYQERDFPIRPVDNWYADLSDDADWIPDVALGRLPVGSLDELARRVQTIDKERKS